MSNVTATKNVNANHLPINVDFMNALQEIIKDKGDLDQEVLTNLCEGYELDLRALFNYGVRSSADSVYNYVTNQIQTDAENIRLDFTNRYKAWSIIFHTDMDCTDGDIRGLIRRNGCEGFRYFELTAGTDGEPIFRFVDFAKAIVIKDIPVSGLDFDSLSVLDSSSVKDTVDYVKAGCIPFGPNQPGKFKPEFIDEYLFSDLVNASDYMVSTGLQTSHDKNMFLFNGNDETFSEQSTVYFVPLKEGEGIELELKLQLLYKNKTKGYSISSHCNITMDLEHVSGIPSNIRKCSFRPSTGHTVYLSF